MMPRPYFDDGQITIYHGDCLESMAQLEDSSIDAIVTDPPYGIGFMGREWDVFNPEAVATQKLASERKGTEKKSDAYPDRFGKSQGGGVPIRYDETLGGNQRFQAWMTGWATECLRILKPGGHLLAFGGTRTYHRLACAIEDAGFEVRDSLLWLYGSGFPKSLDVSKAIDKAAGAEREVVAESRWGDRDSDQMLGQVNDDGWKPSGSAVTAPATPEAAVWEGWGTALKPSHEPIVVARKPFHSTVAANVLEHGTGALNIDGCRVGWGNEGDQSAKRKEAGYSEAAKKALGGVVASESETGFSGEVEGSNASNGRWPANVVLSHTPLCEPVGTRIVKGDPRDTGDGERPSGFADVGAENGDGEPNAPVYGDEEVIEWDCAPGCPVAALDAQSGERRSAGEYSKGARGGANDFQGPASINIDGLSAAQYSDSGGASRFFYCAKTSRAERNAGLEGFEERLTSGVWGGEDDDLSDGKKPTQPRANVHPTVKPINLMRWLVRLVTPPGGTCLDPFLGSGTTGCAAILEGFDFIGIEREAEYIAIAEARIAFWSQHQGKEIDDVLELNAASQKQASEHLEAGQLDLLGGSE